MTQKITTPREDCKQVQVQKQAPVKDENRVAGTVIGGVAGGLLGGYAIGGGTRQDGDRGRGRSAGNQVQKNMQQKDVATTTETRCTTVNRTSQKLIGYDVTYRLDGKEKVVRTSFRPGPQIPVKAGAASWC